MTLMKKRCKYCVDADIPLLTSLYAQRQACWQCDETYLEFNKTSLQDVLVSWVLRDKSGYSEGLVPVAL